MAFGNYGYNPYAWSNPFMAPQYQQQMPQIPPISAPYGVQPNNGIRWVQGEAGAKAYPVAAGESAFLMDSENSLAYFKSVDQSGMPTMRYFSITEISPESLTQKPAEPAPMADYATQDDLSKVREEIGRLRKTLKTLQAAMEGTGDE